MVEMEYVFDDVLVIKNGKNQKAVENPEGQYPIYGSGGIMGYADNYTCEADTVIIGRKGSINNPIYVSEPFWNVDTAFGLSAKRELLLPKYLFYFCKKFDFEKLNKTVTIPSLTKSDLLKIKINLPNISVQQEVIDKLSKIESVIDLRKQELSTLDSLMKARFVEMFGDFDLSHSKASWKTISEIGTVVGGATPKTNIEKYWNGEYRWISPAELQQDSGIIYESVKKITQEGIDSCSLQELPIGTVILSSRAPIGKMAIAGNTFYCNQGFKNIICKENIIPRYLYSLLLFNTKYLNSLGRGATFKEISKSIVERIAIPVPDKDKQIEFENFCKQIDKSKAAVQAALDKAQLLFDSLMQEYFG